MSFVVVASLSVALFGRVAPPQAGGAKAAVAPRPAPDSVLRLVDFAGLPDLEAGVTCRQFSSSDPEGRGDDHGHFLELDEKRAVLAEMDGPGVVTRLWSANAAGRLRVFLDGEQSPRIDTPFAELFEGKYAPFVPPVATHQGGGFVSYLPIAYASHCRIEVAGLDDPHALYYHVQYKTFPAGTPIRTFTRELPPAEKKGLAAVVEVFRDSEHWPLPMEVVEKDRGAARAGLKVARAGNYVQYVKLPPGRKSAARKDAWAIPGPGTIDFLRVDVEEPDVEKLRGLVLEIWFGDATEPSVSAPVADLFNVGFGARPQAGMLLGWGEHGGYSRMPMPIPKGCAVALSNLGREEASAFLEFTVAPGAPPFPNLFHAEYRRSDPVGGELFDFCRAEGAGKYVGANFTLQGVGDLWYLEGNEQFLVDGEGKPSILGTGTEDFFNGGWYWDGGPFTQALYGLGVKEEWTTNRTTPWRHQVNDCVPFRNTLIARLEHGSANEVLDGSYSSVAFWYGDVPHSVRRVSAESTWLPRRWIRRPKDSLVAASFEWSAASQMVPTKYEAVSNDFRGCEFRLFQAFPVSRFERGEDKQKPEFALLRADEASATFQVEVADRVSLRLQFAADKGAPPLDVLLDEKPLGQVDLMAVRIEGDGMTPATAPPLGPVGLATGRHTLTLRRSAEGRGNSVRVGLDSVVLESASPLVKSWWVAPPVKCLAPEDPDRAPDPNAPPLTVDQVPDGEAKFVAKEFDPKAAGWKEVAHDTGTLDLAALVTRDAPIFAYLQTYVFAPEARTATVKLGSDDGVRVWLNGKVVLTHAVHRPLAPDSDSFEVALAKGWNTLLVKVRNDDGAFGLTVRLADPDGKLKTSTKRE
jgi:hypothetical protein